MACLVRRVKNNITEVKTPQDKDSELYKKILDDVKGLDTAAIKTLQDRFRPWVGRHINNLTKGDLALGLYKQAFSENFSNFFGDWRNDPKLPNLDINGEPQLTESVRDYLFNGTGKTSQDLTSGDRPVYSKEVTTGQKTAVDALDNMKVTAPVTKASETQENILNNITSISSLERDAAMDVLNKHRDEIHKTLSQLIDGNGRIIADAESTGDDAPRFYGIKERLQSYPENAVFKVNHEVASEKAGKSANVDLMVVYDKDGQPAIDFFDYYQIDTQGKSSDYTPWYLERALQSKLSTVRDILVKNGIDPNYINKMEALPILKDAEDHYRVGVPDTINETVNELLPVTIKEQITGDTAVDNILSDLYKRREANDYSQSLHKAIKFLQEKFSAKPLIYRTEKAVKEADESIQDWDTEYKGLDFNNVGDQPLNDYIEKVTSQMDELQNFIKYSKDLREKAHELEITENQIDYHVGKANQKYNDLFRIAEEFNEKYAESRGVEGISDPERTVSKTIELFADSNKITTGAMQVLTKISMKSYLDASKKAQTVDSQLMKIKDSVTKRYGSQKEFFKLIADSGKHQLYPKISEKFDSSLKEAVKHKDLNWLKDNVDIEAYRKEINRQRDEAELQASDIGDPIREAEEMDRIESLYDLSTPQSEGWFHQSTISRFPQEAKWYSDQYKNLLKPENKEALDAYNYIVDYNRRAAEFGYLPKSIDPDTFMPWSNSTFLEMLAKGSGFFKAGGDTFWRSITEHGEEVGIGQIDPTTGKPIRQLPRYMISKVENASENILADYAQFAKFVELYGEMSQVEGIVRNMSRIERAKGSLATNNFGRLLPGAQELPTNKRNADIFDNMVDALVYGHRNISDSNFDIYLGKVPAWFKKANNKLGFKLFNETYIGKSISFTKTMDALIHYTQFKVLSLNPLSSLSNFLGGQYQSIINAGTYFTKGDFASSEYIAASYKKMPKADMQFYKAAMDYFLISDHLDPTHKTVKKLTPGLSSEAISDAFSSGLRFGDIAVRLSNGIALLKNMAVVDGKVVNARDYIRSTPEYQERYFKSQAERDAMQKSFDSQVDALLRTNGLRENSKIVDGELVINGVDRFDPSVNKMLAIHQDLVEKAIGPLSEYQKRGINQHVIGRAAMLFKNWIPALYDQRFGDLTFNSATEKMEWGRMRTAVKFLAKETIPRLNNFVGTIKATEKGMKDLDNFYNETKTRYEEKNGKAFKMSKPEFYDMVRNNIKTAAYDTLASLTTLGAFLGLGALANTVKGKERSVPTGYRFFLKALDKAKDEVTYFYDPRNLVQLMGTSVFPAARTVQQFIKVMQDTMERGLGLVWNGTDVDDNISLTKDYVKLIPGQSIFTSLIPLFSDQLSKDLDIRITPNQNFTY